MEARLDDLRACVPGGAGRHEWANLPESFTDVLPEIETALGDLAKELENLGGGAGTANCARRAQALAASLGALGAVPEESGLRWVEAAASGLSLHFTPFEIADRLRAYVEARPCAWVFTSATLAIGDDFSHFAARIGLPDARTLHIESPFDYPTQARIYLPRNMPGAAASGVCRQIHRRLCAVAGGERRARVHSLYQLSRPGRGSRGAQGALSAAAVSGARAGTGAA